MAEQEANQGTENPQTSEQAGEATANGGGAGGQVFSQDEVNRMIKARAERELKAVLADVGLSDLGELKTLVQQKRASEDANKSELAKAQERAAELEKQLADAAEKQKALSTLSDVTAKAAKLGIVGRPFIFVSLRARPAAVHSRFRNILPAVPAVIANKANRAWVVRADDMLIPRHFPIQFAGVHASARGLGVVAIHPVRVPLAKID